MLIVFGLGLALLIAGCKQQVSSAKEKKSIKVARIVFLGQKEACDCTRTRIDTSWQALQSANNTSPQVPVERLQIDVDQKAAEQYTKMKSPMVMPGIYFLDDKGGLVEFLQGEISADQITKLL
jgi:hypothetical protein